MFVLQFDSKLSELVLPMHGQKRLEDDATGW